MRPLNLFTEMATQPMNYLSSSNYVMMDRRLEKECLKYQCHNPPQSDDFEIVYEHSKRLDK